MELVGDVKYPKQALLLSLGVWHYPRVIELIVGLKPQRLINLNTINLRHIAIDVAFNTCLLGTQIRAGLREDSVLHLLMGALNCPYANLLYDAL